jgi:hypothetical protein
MAQEEDSGDNVIGQLPTAIASLALNKSAFHIPNPLIPSFNVVAYSRPTLQARRLQYMYLHGENLSDK